MLRPQIFEYSEKLRILQLEVADFATELIARYQPVARDLRFIQSGAIDNRFTYEESVILVSNVKCTGLVKVILYKLCRLQD